MKNKSGIQDMETLLNVKEELKKHLAEKEAVVIQTAGFVGKVAKILKKKPATANGTPVEDNSFQNVSKQLITNSLKSFADKVVHNEKNQKIAIGIVAILSLIITGIVTSKVKNSLKKK